MKERGTKRRKGDVVTSYHDQEKEVQAFWDKHRIYERVKEKCRSGRSFYFCDGPPYVTGMIHPGTALNKCIKDAVLRFWRFMGRDVRAQPGFDTHGLPIEVKVEQKLGLKSKKEIEDIGIERFVCECRLFAEHYIKVMTEQFKSLGVWMDWDRPYITFKDDYIERSWSTIKRAEEQGLLKRGKYVVAFCPRCETSVANYELEYKERVDPSIFVKFPVKGEARKYLIIWTTTPWTLVANLAVMAHPDEIYVEVDVEGERWIMAKARMEAVLSKANKDAVVVREFLGKELENLPYDHPFQDLIAKVADRRVVLSKEYVSMEEGSGLVHCAPGHGYEDFLVGRAKGLEPFSPVDDRGCYTAEAGSEFEGMNVFEANESIIHLLEERGLLVWAGKVRHRYPHCWRCKSPLLFRATEQWFIEISKLRGRMLEELDRVLWVPEFVRTRMRNFVSEAPDWCISRQRYWGIPLPIWICEKCGKRKVIGSKAELGQHVEELHRPYIDEVVLRCECGGEMRRVKDVLDVWFDSGNAVWASLDDEDRRRYGERADFIVEGQDQIRGWFYSLLGSGIVRNGTCPYRVVMLHGFFVDEKGEKMSKSVGNFVPLEEILQKYGADAFRLWGLSNVLWEDIKFVWQGVAEARRDLNTFVNMVVFLTRFFRHEWGKELRNVQAVDFEDRWLLSRLERTKQLVKENMECYYLHEAVRALRRFLLDDVSRFYLKLVKERKGTTKWKQKMLLLAKALQDSTLLLGIFAPHTAERVYQAFFRRYCGEESLFFLSFPEINQRWISDEVERKMALVREVVSAVLEQRQKAGINLRWPLPKLVVKNKELEEAKEVIALLTNVKAVEFADIGQDIMLDTTITPELELEGLYAELKRRVQALRKEMGLVESDKIKLVVGGDERFRVVVKRFSERLKAEVGAIAVSWGEGEKEFKVKDLVLKLKAERA